MIQLLGWWNWEMCVHVVFRDDHNQMLLLNGQYFAVHHKIYWFFRSDNLSKVVEALLWLYGTAHNILICYYPPCLSIMPILIVHIHSVTIWCVIWCLGPSIQALCLQIIYTVSHSEYCIIFYAELYKIYIDKLPSMNLLLWCTKGWLEIKYSPWARPWPNSTSCAVLSFA